MKLQKFVTDVIEAMGGIVIPQEYALCHVMVPEHCKEMFQGREELQLAFDYEVAEENPQAEFVTIGSYLVEQLIDFVQRKPVSAVRFVDIDPPALSGAADKIRRFLGEESKNVELLRERSVMGAWAVFSFRIGFLSDEKEEQFERVWVDLSRNIVCEEMRRHQHLIGFTDKPVLFGPLASPCDLASAFKLAYGWMKERAERERESRIRRTELEREKRRIADYYDELKRETLKRAERKGLTEEKKAELLDKAGSIGLEQQKQLEEIEAKYSVRTTVALDHGLLVLAPLLEYSVFVAARKTVKEMKLHYNPMLKQFVIISQKSGEEVLARG